MSPRTRESISSRIGRTSSTDRPEGSRSSQSRYRFPGKIGQASPQPIVITTSAACTTSVVKRLRELLGQIEPDLVHHGDHGRIDLVGWRAARRPDVHTPLRVVIEERGRHLRSAGVVDADEQDLGDFLHDLASRLGHRGEPLPREPLCEDRNVDLDLRVGQAGGRLRHDLKNRFRREDPPELLGQASGRRIETDIHLDSSLLRVPPGTTLATTRWMGDDPPGNGT